MAIITGLFMALSFVVAGAIGFLMKISLVDMSLELSEQNGSNDAISP